MSDGQELPEDFPKRTKEEDLYLDRFFLFLETKKRNRSRQLLREFHKLGFPRKKRRCACCKKYVCHKLLIINKNEYYSELIRIYLMQHDENQ